MELNDKTMGIWCKEDSTWYYLEAGPYQPEQKLSKLKTVLASRELISHIRTSNEHSINYRIMSHLDAVEKGYKVKPIFLNAHIKDVFLQTQEKATSSGPWN